MTPVPREGWFLIEFLNGISRNTGKCKLGRFSLRQSHLCLVNFMVLGLGLLMTGTILQAIL